MVDFNKIQENIKKLNGAWKQWAEEADRKADEKQGGKKDGILLNSAFEIDYVKNKAINMYKESDSSNSKAQVASVFQNQLGIEKSDVDAIMDGTYFKNAKKERSAIQADSQLDVLNNYVASGKENFEKTGDWDALEKTIRAHIDSSIHSDPEYYNQLGTELRTVIDAFKAVTKTFEGGEYNSRNDVMQLYTVVLARMDLKDNDEFKDFKMNLLEKFATLAEERQIKKETNIVDRRFNELVKIMGREKAAEQVKKEYANRGSYYNSYNKPNINEALHPEVLQQPNGEVVRPSHEGIIDKLDDNVALEHAKKEVDKIIEDLKRKVGDNDAELSSKDIEKSIIAELKNRGTYDQYTIKYMEGRTDMSTEEILTFQKSSYKSKRKTAAATRRANAIMQKHFTYNELKKEISSDNTYVQRLLNKDVTLLDDKGDPVINKDTKEPVKLKAFKLNSDGTYDISGLSMFIRRTIGKDLLASPEPSKLNVYDEIANVAKGLGISKGDAKNLIKMCGYDVESKNWAKIFMEAFVDTAIGAIPGMTTSALGVAGNVAEQMVSGQIISGQLLNVFKEFLVANIKYNNDQDWSIDINIEGIDVEIDEDSIQTQIKHQGVNYSVWDDNVQNFVTYQKPLSEFLDYDPHDGNRLTLTFKKDNHGEINIYSIVDENVQGENIKTPDRIAKEAGINGKDRLIVQVLKGFAIQYVVNVLRHAMDTEGTKPILNPDFDTTLSKDDYIEMHINNNPNLKPELKKAFIMLVNNFVHDELDAEGKVINTKWDAQGYRELLSTMAGPSSHLTAPEAYAYLNQYKYGKDDEVQEKASAEVKGVSIAGVVNDLKPNIKQINISDNRYAIRLDEHINVGNTGWEEIVKIYGNEFPLDKDGGRKLRTRMFKVMQGMQGTKLTVEQIRAMAEVSMKDIKGVKRDSKGNLDPADYAKKAKAVFDEKMKNDPNFAFLKSYKFDFNQFALSVCRSMPGDNQNEIIAPETLYHNSGAEVKRNGLPHSMTITKDNRSDEAVGDRGTVGQTGEGRVSKNGVKRDVTLQEALQKKDAGSKLDRTLYDN